MPYDIQMVYVGEIGYLQNNLTKSADRQTDGQTDK